MCSVYGIAFHGAGSWSFGNDFIENVDNSSSSHANNRRNNILVVGESPTYSINRSFGSPEEKFSINFSKANTFSFESTL